MLMPMLMLPMLMPMLMLLVCKQGCLGGAHMIAYIVYPSLFGTRTLADCLQRV